MRKLAQQLIGQSPVKVAPGKGAACCAPKNAKADKGMACGGSVKKGKK